MEFDYRKQGELKINMTKYVKNMLNNFPVKLGKTIVFHVDDLKSSHKLKSVNDKFEKWLNSMYGKHRKVTPTRGQVHNYLRMELDYQKQGELKINMTKYVENMLNDFLLKLGKKEV
jgi:nucleoside-specific outer membrane channel protein Tsx